MIYRMMKFYNYNFFTNSSPETKKIDLILNMPLEINEYFFQLVQKDFAGIDDDAEKTIYLSGDVNTIQSI